MADRAQKGVKLFLCDCGPILAGALELEALRTRFACYPGVLSVQRHTALCSTDGKAWMREQLQGHPGCAVVVAGCSPREHEATFSQVCREAGVFPHLLAMANVREHCVWVTPERARAAEKADRLIRGALARAARLEELAEREVDCSTDCLVVGAGLAGLAAARVLAQAGRRVYLVERSAALGGRTARLAHVYPALECAPCMVAGWVDDVLHDERIEVFTATEVVGVLGSVGRFTVQLRRRAMHVDVAGCYGCRTCEGVCPVEVLSEADEGLGKRKAISTAYAGAVPNAPSIDEAACLHGSEQGCEACAQACPFGNISLEARPTELSRHVGAIVIATGAEPAPLRLSGPRVLPAMALERLMSPAGPTGGELVLADGTSPRSVVLLHCSGEAGQGPRASCSKTCCMSLAKYALEIADKLPGCELHQLLWSACTPGPGYREFFQRAAQGGRVRREWLGPEDRVEAVEPRDGGVSVAYTCQGEPKRLQAELAVVVPPLRGAAGIESLAAQLGVKCKPGGFLQVEHERLGSYRTAVEGILVAGSAQGPKDTQEACAHGAAAAGHVLSILVAGRKLKVLPATAVVQQERCGACRTCVLACPYGAIGFDEAAGAARIEELLCRGCGSCAAACPSGAVQARHFTDEQLVAEMDAMVSEMDATGPDRRGPWMGMQGGWRAWRP
jgi:heterodisulfide reductase subunit A